MTFEMVIGGVKFRMDPAAISAIRYRAEYGDSIVNHLADCQTADEAEGRLLRMCHCMIPAADRPELLDFAKLARKDEDFIVKALVARDELMGEDPQWHGKDDSADQSFDEYRVLALIAAAHLDMTLIYELPIIHLVGIAGRYFEAQSNDPDDTSYHKMDTQEMARLYPRRG